MFRSSILFFNRPDSPGLQKQIGTALMYPRFTVGSDCGVFIHNGRYVHSLCPSDLMLVLMFSTAFGLMVVLPVGNPSLFSNLSTMSRYTTSYFVTPFSLATAVFKSPKNKVIGAWLSSILFWKVVKVCPSIPDAISISGFSFIPNEGSSCL